MLVCDSYWVDDTVVVVAAAVATNVAVDSDDDDDNGHGDGHHQTAIVPLYQPFELLPKHLTLP